MLGNSFHGLKVGEFFNKLFIYVKYLSAYLYCLFLNQLITIFLLSFYHSLLFLFLFFIFSLSLLMLPSLFSNLFLVSINLASFSFPKPYPSAIFLFFFFLLTLIYLCWNMPQIYLGKIIRPKENERWGRVFKFIKKHWELWWYKIIHIK